MEHGGDEGLERRLARLERGVEALEARVPPEGGPGSDRRAALRARTRRR